MVSLAAATGRAGSDQLCTFSVGGQWSGLPFLLGMLVVARLATSSPWPFSVANLLDYLDEKFEAGSIAKSVPGAIAASLSVLEVVGKGAEEDLISTDPLWKATQDV